jgi:ATP-binding cassette subfamily B multidrug efflux pump
MGNYPMRIRWQVHRYLLKQSMTFYQDEFAGRIATKLMQTALAVRECVIKLIDVLNYVVVYFLGALLIVGSPTGGWRCRSLVWLVCYIGCCCAFSSRARQGVRGSRPTRAR